MTTPSRRRTEGIEGSRLWWFIVALATGTLLSSAAGAVDLGANPSECEIQAALLGAASTDCPPIVRPVAPKPAVVSPPPAGFKPAPPPIAAEPSLRASFRITFAFASAAIAPESRGILDRIAAVMASPGATALHFRIVGHTDAVGSPAANLTLSLRRAEAVRDDLVRRHAIAPDRLEIEGRGQSQLADPAHPKAAVNRRVEIITLGS